MLKKSSTSRRSLFWFLFDGEIQVERCRLGALDAALDFYTSNDTADRPQFLHEYGEICEALASWLGKYPGLTSIFHYTAQVSNLTRRNPNSCGVALGVYLLFAIKVPHSACAALVIL